MGQRAGQRTPIPADFRRRARAENGQVETAMDSRRFLSVGEAAHESARLQGVRLSGDRVGQPSRRPSAASRQPEDPRRRARTGAAPRGRAMITEDGRGGPPQHPAPTEVGRRHDAARTGPGDQGPRPRVVPAHSRARLGSRSTGGATARTPSSSGLSTATTPAPSAVTAKSSSVPGASSSSRGQPGRRPRAGRSGSGCPTAGARGSACHDHFRSR